jgi:F-type H+-transporting ATPase subunit c
MKKLFALLIAGLIFLPAGSAFAQDGVTVAPVATELDAADADQRGAIIDSSLGRGLGILGLGLGLGLLMYGAAMGIGNIGGRAAESIARQPEAGGRIFTTMIISAALIEGATLFAIVAVIIK